MLIDGHCHVGEGWYEPAETLLFHMDRNHVEKAVLVQIWAQLDNTYQRDCVERAPGRFASVVRVDETSRDAPEQLRREVEQGAVGVRLRPSTLSPGDDPWAIWRTAAELDIPVSAVGSPEAFASDGFRNILEEFPSLPVVIEHMGELAPLADDYDSEVDARILALGALPNAYVKFSGIGEYAARQRNPVGDYPFVEPVPDLLERTIKAFGTDKAIWGSDFPPVSRREGYANALRFTRERLEKLGVADLDLLYGGTADRLFFGDN